MTNETNYQILYNGNFSNGTELSYEEEQPPYDKYLVALLSRFTALLSMIASYVFIHEVIKDHKNQRHECHQHHHRRGQNKAISRVLLSMSVADIFFSLGWFLSTWMAPKELDFLWGQPGESSNLHLSRLHHFNWD